MAPFMADDWTAMAAARRLRGPPTQRPAARVRENPDRRRLMLFASIRAAERLALASLVQQWHLPDRFAYGTLAALRMAPFMADDWIAMAAARRLRGLQAKGPAARIRETRDRLLVMLVASIRRAERLALAMD